MSEIVPGVLRIRTPPRSAVENVAPVDGVADILDEKTFLKVLCLERKRTERSLRRFVLMLLDSGSLLRASKDTQVVVKTLRVLTNSTRETDVKGWYQTGSTFGVIFTEIGETGGRTVTNALQTRVTQALCNTLRIEDSAAIRLSFHVFPKDSEDNGSGDDVTNSPLYPDLAVDNGGDRLLKRSMDILGSLLALLIFSPLFLVIAAAVKLTSKGPVLFRQERVGQYGKRFTFLKFRSMYFGNDHSIHQEFVKKLIAGRTDGSPGHESGIYKITKDPRVTSIGKFLRRTSLDELPQFLNVLRGDMSLVGPRPPIPYEFDCYSIWQKRRLLEVRPGITGLWQVGGRSRVKFDEMVRLDLRYARTRSLWLDVKILLRTPLAVFSGDGAF